MMHLEIETPTRKKQGGGCGRNIKPKIERRFGGERTDATTRTEQTSKIGLAYKNVLAKIRLRAKIVRIHHARPPHYRNFPRFLQP